MAPGARDADDGILDRYPKPGRVLGQHVTPLPAGVIGVRSGTQMAASDGAHRHPARAAADTARARTPRSTPS